MNTRCVVAVLLAVWVAVSLSCARDEESAGEQNTDAWRDKVAFDLSQIRPDGLAGPPDGLVSVSYEFCIPKDPELVKEVRAIDPSVQLVSAAPGRIGCGDSEYLCLGDTHKPNWREILKKTASLDYVTRIERVYWE
jgi:hypothetical protein